MKKITFAALCLMMFCEQVWARAGGAGGGHSSGGGGHSYGGGYSHGHSYSGYSSYGHSTPVGGVETLIFIIVVVILVILIIRIQSRSQSQSTYDDQGSGGPSIDPSKFKPIPMDMSALGGDTPEEISRKVATAFMLIQGAWSQKRLDVMRRFITDGVYQRFNAQFTMMNILTQSNFITNVHIQRMTIAKSFQEGGHDCIDVRIQAVATDQFVCEKYPNLRSPGGTESFVEYWSFIRRHDHKKGLDIYHSENCPQCAAPLTDKLMESARCPYCGTYINNGEYDWVLSEITQADQYGSSFAYMNSLPPMASTPLSEVIAAYPQFSVQVLEDRASNALMQVLISTATGNISMLQRFTTPTAFANLQKTFPEQALVYNRLYTGAVDMLGIQLQGNLLRAFIGVQYYAHKILLEQASLATGEDSPLPYTTVLVMVRELSELTAKGSVYANSCAHCGAPQKDNLSPKCEYCGSSLNDAKLDWIVEEIKDLRGM